VSLDKKFNRLLITGKSESNNRLSSLLRVIEQSPLLTRPVLEFIQASKDDSGLLSDFKMHLALVGAEAPPPPPEPKSKAGTAANKTGASK
jgi:type IV pilus assembly protein PilN